MPLTQVIDRLNRYRPTPIRFEAAELDGLNVSGAFPLTDADRALRSISAALPVTIERREESLTIRRR
jgi:transmembrane sensor